MTDRYTLHNCDVFEGLARIPDRSVQMCFTSPPYFALRSYLPSDHPDKAKEIGSEPTIDAYIDTMVRVFREVRRTLRDDGLCFINIGDSYCAAAGGSPSKKYVVDAPSGGTDGVYGRRYRANHQGKLDGEDARKTTYDGMLQSGIKPKNLLLVPSRLALALQSDGWIIRSFMPWLRRNAMPESVRDRPSSSIEWVIMASKRPAYFYDAEAVRRRHARIWDESNGGSWSNGKGDAQRIAERGRAGTHSGPYPLPNASGRSWRNSDSFYDSLGMMTDDDGEPLAFDVNPEPTRLEHYASFPTRLVRDPLLAGTSERGCCPQCGAPWMRIVEVESRPNRPTAPFGKCASGDAAYINRASFGEDRLRRSSHGWKPSCACVSGDPIPCTILDPFAGLSTVGIVALRYGRRFIGIELSSQYADMSRKRLDAVHPLLPSESEEDAGEAVYTNGAFDL